MDPRKPAEGRGWLQTMLTEMKVGVCFHHAEYINRPTAFFVDMDGVLRFLYQGTYWGDRPSVPDLLEMARSGNYVFDAPKRLKPKTP